MKRTPPVWAGAGSRAELSPDPELGLLRVEVVSLEGEVCGRLTPTVRGWLTEPSPGYPFKRKAEAVDFLAWKRRQA